MEKYESMLREINLEIEKFNSLLAEGFKVSPLNASDPKSSRVITDVPFATVGLNSVNISPGVYALCCYRQSDSSRVGAYIGKSSSRMGSRIIPHLRPNSPTGSKYQRKDRSGELFVIEAFVATLLSDQMRTFASALEEFIIAGVGARVHLLNRIGSL
jgi:hypothetical protein